MVREQHRHDISDRAWEKIRPYTIGAVSYTHLIRPWAVCGDAHGGPPR